MRQALEDYATAMAYCREESFSILDDLDALVVRPADRFHMITKTIDKTITKREHKLIDFDRHRVAYMKYSAIQEPSPSEEKNMFKLQTQFDNAAADYDYFNNMLKDELARFLDLSQEFIEPVFRQFYNIQSRVVAPFIPDRPTYADRRPSISDRQSSMSSSYSSDRKPPPPLAQKPSFSSISERPSYPDRRPRPSVSERPPINSPRQLPALSPRPSYNARSRSMSTSNTPPPIKSSSTNVMPSSYNSSRNGNRQDGANGMANRKELVEALYELNAPQDGDLSFHVGDVIEVLEKSDKTHDWWKGRLGDRTGMFPGKLLTTKVVAQVIHD
ncbi:hypothetical protein MUCCIDRAFT_144394 [Mucor lusitanicus CBS 277.49]|uniref:SH3 domain-containing protein n=1 Tax=Mucor lusitanicus CBS 277.49 TaxID=747725 RepID=A0A168K2Q0_MUCCL|nr:hypothetical protein MUCCIDRAFT_144394 [Mucor lusitanicus CBS 277.49]